MGGGVRPERVTVCQKTSEIMKLNRIPWFTALVAAGTLITSAFAAEEKEAAKPKDKPAAGDQAAKSKPRAQVDQMAEQLKLSEDQKTKLRPILQEETRKLREIRQDTSLEADQKTSKTKEIRVTYAGKMKEILTPDQYTTWEKGRADRAKRAQGRRPNAARPKKAAAADGADKKPAKE